MFHPADFCWLFEPTFIFLADYSPLTLLLSRESLSKETDSALLTVIGYPAFAVEKPLLIEKTMECIMGKLNREYGCIRFLRDGYKTPREDSSRSVFSSVTL